MGVVADMIARFQKLGIPAFFENTGGGCMCVRVEFGPNDNRGMPCHWVWITERDDNFSRADIDGTEDDTFSGFLACIYFGTPEGDRIENENGSEIVLWKSLDELVSAQWVADGVGESMPPGAVPVDLAWEAKQVVDRVAWTVVKAAYAEKDGRTDGWSVARHDHHMAVPTAADEWELSW